MLVKQDIKYVIPYYNMGKSAHATLWHFFILFISFETEVIKCYFR